MELQPVATKAPETRRRMVIRRAEIRNSFMAGILKRMKSIAGENSDYLTIFASCPLSDGEIGEGGLDRFDDLGGIRLRCRRGSGAGACRFRPREIFRSSIGSNR